MNEFKYERTKLFGDTISCFKYMWENETDGKVLDGMDKCIMTFHK